MMEQSIQEDSEDEELQVQLQESRERSSYYPQCQRRYPRLFPRLFWIYLFLEGLCFVTDVAFLSSTIMAAHTNNLYSNTTTDTDGSSSTVAVALRGRLLEEDDDDDDDWLVQSAFKLNQKQKTQDNFNWNSFQDNWIFQQLHTQWLQQQEFMLQWILGMKEEQKNTDRSSIPT